jgi:hypothetical protein
MYVRGCLQGSENGRVVTIEMEGQTIQWRKEKRQKHKQRST